MSVELFDKATNAVRLYYLKGVMSNKKKVIEFFKSQGLENEISFVNCYGLFRYGDFSKLILIGKDKDGFYPEI